MPDLTHDPDSNNTLKIAQRFGAVVFSVIPILTDGSKAPACEWKQFQSERADERRIRNWFDRRQPSGIGLVHGAISGNSEAIDCDLGELWPEFYAEALSAVPALDQAPVVLTPRQGGGYQLITRCIEPPRGNLVLAQRHDPAKPGKFKTAIETRGEGGYSVTIGSPAQCHPTGRPYRLIAGSFNTIPVLTPEDRANIHSIALKFDQRPPISGTDRRETREAKTGTAGDRPGDVFNRIASWSVLLESHGWSRVGRERRGVRLWKRPGKGERGHSATENYGGYDLLYVFSSSASPLESGRAYTKFGAFVALEHHGDFAAAAYELARSQR